MTQNYSLFLFSLSLLFQFLFVNSQKPPVPALYILGDSTVDSGNNNFLPTVIKANYKPYGIDFPSGDPTGRTTNGKTIVDFIAEELGLPMVPPYLSLSESAKSKTITGINYASASAGILPETGRLYAKFLPLDEQIQHFEATVTKDLPKYFKTAEELSHHLAKSILFIMIGSNDYIVNYLDHENYDSSRTHTPEGFAMLLVNRLKERLTKLHDLGARKMVVFGLIPIGCQPAIMQRSVPKPNTLCNETANRYIVMYNDRLASMLTELGVTLPQSTFILGDTYVVADDINRNPHKFGFSGGHTPCCQLNEIGFCVPHKTPCPDRNAHIFWDLYHPTEAYYKILADGCFSADLCTPMNIKNLLLKESSFADDTVAGPTAQTHSKTEL